MSKKKQTAQPDIPSILLFLRDQVRPWHWVIVLSFLFCFSIAAGAYISYPQSRSVSVEYIPNTSIREPYEYTNDPPPEPIAQPVRREFSVDAPAYLSAQAILVMDLESGVRLFEKNPKQQLWPASTTKIMTSIIAVEEYDLDEVVEVGVPVSEGSSMGLVQGEKIKVKHLIQGALIQSANDAAFALAAHHEGGHEGFIAQMNTKAFELGLENTHYYDPAGFDHEKQYSTVSDLALISKYALNNPTIQEAVATPLLTVSDESYTHFHRLQNVNQLLGSVPGVAGVKTGWTENAKENLVNLTIRDGHRILTVVLGSNDRFGETILLTDWAFANHEWIDSRYGG